MTDYSYVTVVRFQHCRTNNVLSMRTYVIYYSSIVSSYYETNTHVIILKIELITYYNLYVRYRRKDADKSNPSTSTRLYGVLWGVSVEYRSVTTVAVVRTGI